MILFKLPSLANSRLHWAAKAKISAKHRKLGKLLACGTGLKEPPFEVRFVRVGKRLLDDDNLASAFKSIRDGFAEYFGVDDGPSGPIKWSYGQEKGEYAIYVQVRERTPIKHIDLDINAGT